MLQLQKPYIFIIMIVSRAHKIKLYLDCEQQTYCSQSAGVARFAYNWALSQWSLQYQAFKDNKIDKPPSEGNLRKLFNQLKKNPIPPYFLVLSPEYQRNYFPWVTQVSKYCPQEAIKNLGKAFSRFFKKQGKYPRYKKKGIHDSFYIGNDQFKIIDKNNKQYIKLPLLDKPIELKEKLRFEGKINNVVISRTANHWYASISVNTELAIKQSPNKSCGIDVGCKTLAVVCDTDGNITNYANPKAYNKNLKRLKYLQRQLSRKKKGSNNRKKAQLKVAKYHAYIRNIREDNLHKLTTTLVNNYKEINIEDLNVKGMLKNRKLSRSIADTSFYRFKQMLEYKSKVKGCTIVEIDRFFPSSQLCSHCGEQNKELKLSERQWQCKHCNINHDRDENAARNILNYHKYEKIKINNKQIPKELGEFKPMESSLFNNHIKWKLKEFVEVGKKVNKSTQIHAKISFE